MHPTRDSRETGSSEEEADEAREWPTRARALALMRLGFSHSEACDLTPLDTQMYLSVAHALSIPPEHRAGGGAVMATKAQLLSALR